MPQSARTATGRYATSSELSLEQILDVIGRLDASARSRVAQALVESEMDSRFEQLILRIANRPPVDEISDDEIQVEVNAVRRARLPASLGAH